MSSTSLAGIVENGGQTSSLATTPTAAAVTLTESASRMTAVTTTTGGGSMVSVEEAAAAAADRKTDGALEHPADVYHCGWFSFRPRWIQTFMTPKWALFWLCWAGAVQGLIVNGFINVVITTIERRFGLRSTQTGLVASGYDIASFLCLVPVSYFGGRLGASKPRWIGWGVAVMGLGAFVFALPHFLVGQYRATNSEPNVCLVPAESAALGMAINDTSAAAARLLAGEICTSLDESSYGGAPESSENLSWNVWFFFTAQLLLGAGASPLYTLGVTFIDENVSKKMSSVYLGIYYTMAVVGPAAGYVIGGQLLLFYTDMFVVDSSVLGLTPHSKVWVGAWWIGFVFMAAFCLLLAIPILAYPRTLPGSEKLEKVSEAHKGDTDAEGQKAFTKIREIPVALAALLKNPTFFFLNLAGASEGLVISGFAVFLPKLIENQFSVTAVWSALLMGIITVPAGGGGTFLGGYLVKKLNLSCSGIIRFCLFATVFAALFTTCFFLSCPNLTFAGVTAPYFPQENLRTPDARSTEPFALLKTLENSCNNKCSCSKMNYEPICGADGVMYYSPCHAGCGEEVNLENAKVYRECSCINGTFGSDEPFRSFEAVNTMCESQCNHLWIFVALCFLVMFFTFLATMPALSATLRCVHDDQRSFALGIQWIKVRVLGTIPAPMIFGRLIDETCILWQESLCEDHGACLVYDNAFMSKYMLLLALIGKACSILFFFGAWFYYIPPKTMSNGSGAGGNGKTPEVQLEHPKQQMNGESVHCHVEKY
ncbi:solute carrier organic anion transporter family member 4A1 [Uranotaenia lowii]|uniref:solute carrier organic anion transporter family member 4A1 n=1 Tax=Uranotaenia lowii TaxID=190385 RepID=UPI00247AA118|nr:solute carrier organic anion transporter family member 4A1 [Uranotaenia lowii]XP_055599367.1 solute carrier organic anion transporter family member 4A1 [Uranotaenia lowii]XP_055599368.1 solute carrier organic anion transporter family member 4A1 [Uranotaenia lowii]XP_055599369.1 solute carrier organic anion transporter family member 4A1 [Uranotaenia lowii]XP_055599370.1 solute carrier organic anion transporter family member 4A1 [Uranotaenia lowii]XP_055599371.1 solute carrier organic anion t